MALCFAVLGLLIFSVLYGRMAHGSFTESMADPAVIVILLFSFMPAAVFSWKAAGFERKISKELESGTDSSSS